MNNKHFISQSSSKSEDVLLVSKELPVTSRDQCHKIYFRTVFHQQYTTTMSTLSNAEKQRILRERRQAKFKTAQASDRLNKITSSNSSFKTVPTQKVEPKANETETSKKIAPVASGRSNRVSAMFDTVPVGIEEVRNKENVEKNMSIPFIHDDPEVSDISDMDTGKSTRNATRASTMTNLTTPSEEEDTEEIINKAFARNFGLPGMGGESTDFDFLKQFSAAVPGIAGDSVKLGASTRDNKLTDLFKAKFNLFKILVLSVIVFYAHFVDGIRVLHTNKATTDVASGRFFNNAFLTSEICFISLFAFYLRSIDYEFQYNSVISQANLSKAKAFVPQFYGIIRKLEALNKYLQIFEFFMNDVYYSIFLFVVLSLIN